jgi:predicted DNA-binding transcriptional regulator YafY
LSEKHLEPQLPLATLAQLQPYFGKARDVLAKSPGNALSRWRSKVRVINRGPALAPPAIRPEAQQAVYEALLKGRKLSARYRSRSSRAASETRLNPLGIVIREQVVYLVAAAWDYTDPIQYALHRFESVELLDEAAKVPAGFDLDAYIAEQKAFSYPRKPGSLQLVLALDTYLAAHLEERRLSADQALDRLPDGRARLRATVPDTEELRWWLLGLGAQVEVLGPRSLRTELRKTFDALSQRYHGRSRLRPKVAPPEPRARDPEAAQ